MTYDAHALAEKYRSYGFCPFPLRPMQKEPPAGTSLFTIDRVKKFPTNANIGIFAGSPDGFAIIDADSEESQAIVTEKLTEMGYYGWTTIVRTPGRNGLHFWVRLTEMPEHPQAYYKLGIGSGEFRVRRPAYVVAPGCRTKAGEYTFVQGGLDTFLAQPAIPWADLTWLSPRTGQRATTTAPADAPKFPYYATPKVLALFDLIRRYPSPPRISYKTGEVLRQTFSSRSEAEAAIVTGLVMAGWSFEQIAKMFDLEKPGHYVNQRDPDRYLERTYLSSVRYLSRERGE